MSDDSTAVESTGGITVTLPASLDAIIEATLKELTDFNRFENTDYTEGDYEPIYTKIRQALTDAYQRGKLEDAAEHAAIQNATAEISEQQQGEYIHQLVHWLMKTLNLPELTIDAKLLGGIFDEASLSVEINEGQITYTRAMT
jgi:hypothetical protein